MTIRDGLILPPAEKDGRPVFVLSPSPEGWLTFFTGAGDDPAPVAPESGRGNGPKLRLSFLGPADQNVEVRFTAPVTIHDGQLIHTPAASWTVDDRWDFSVEIPATTTTIASPANTGNCNLVAQVGYNVIVPAAGNGARTVNLATAAPVPAVAPSDGYWDADQSTGVVTASTSPGAAEWHLLDVAVRSYFMRNMPLGSPRGVTDIDTYKAEWLSERWRLRLRVNKVSAGAGEIGGWLMLFRRFTT